MLYVRDTDDNGLFMREQLTSTRLRRLARYTYQERER